jgi:hypothetical protein
MVWLSYPRASPPCSALRENWSAATGLCDIAARGIIFTAPKDPRWRTCVRIFKVPPMCAMNLPSLVLAILSATTLFVHAQVSPIRISVEQSSKTELKDKKNAHDKTQIRSLKIQLDNNSAQAFDSLVVKYWFIGRPMDERANKVLAEGERKSSLTPRGRELVDSEVVSKKLVEAHTQAAKGKGGKPTKVPASGEKIMGYAVRVMEGDKVLSEYFSEPSYKELIK